MLSKLSQGTTLLLSTSFSFFLPEDSWLFQMWKFPPFDFAKEHSLFFPSERAPWLVQAGWQVKAHRQIWPVTTTCKLRMISASCLCYSVAKLGPILGDPWTTAHQSFPLLQALREPQWLNNKIHLNWLGKKQKKNSIFDLWKLYEIQISVSLKFF